MTAATLASFYLVTCVYFVRNGVRKWDGRYARVWFIAKGQRKS